MNTSWELENNGKKVTIVTTDRDGHTAWNAWEKGKPFFKNSPPFSEFKVTKKEKADGRA